MGTRDAVPKSARVAFMAIADRKEIQLARPQWRQFILSAKLASCSSAVNLRSAVAYTVSSLLPHAPTVRLRSELEKLRDEFMHDICYSVRQAATKENSTRLS